ncbi:MAG: NfeD family protein [Selenomonas sp.]|nr:serine protease [Selenomonadales bacterium]MDD7762658.1 NfeD family protein [Selenomonadales bacterium]MDY5717451.1 NfeD family protein [Selenomonas sp.]
MEFSVSMPVLQMLLLAIMFLAVFVEIKTGGMGAGIMLGIVAAGVFWGSQYVKGLVDLSQIAVFLAGILCIIIEMLMPTVGLLAGAGVAAMLYSVVMTLGGDINAVYAMLVSFAMAVFIFALIVKKLPSSKLWKRLTLKDKSNTANGYVSAEPREELLGKRGIVVTELRPSGSALIADKLVDVISEGAFLTKGEKIIVVAVNGNRVLVRKVNK